MLVALDKHAALKHNLTLQDMVAPELETMPLSP